MRACTTLHILAEVSKVPVYGYASTNAFFIAFSAEFASKQCRQQRLFAEYTYLLKILPRKTSLFYSLVLLVLPVFVKTESCCEPFSSTILTYLLLFRPHQRSNRGFSGSLSIGTDTNTLVFSRKVYFLLLTHQ